MRDDDVNSDDDDDDINGDDDDINGDDGDDDDELMTLDIRINMQLL